MDELASRQLAALGRVDAAFEQAGIAYWLFGGWAVDFHVGSVTRPHDDLDIAVWLDDVSLIQALLDADGWRHAPSEDDDGGTGYEQEDVRLELTYLVREPDGIVFIPLRDGRAAWSPDALGDDVRELQGVRAQIVSREALTRGKVNPRDDPEEASKDRADFAVLRARHEQPSSSAQRGT